MQLSADLTAELLATLARAGSTPDPALAHALTARYAEPHRRYHTVKHLTAVLSTVDDLAAYATEPDVVRLAAWYHDAIYDPRGTDNEERSAQLAESELAGTGLPAGAVAEVARLVRVTAGHDPTPGDSNGAVLSDADLAVLASPAATYDAYVTAVRQEYAHVDEPGWREGRSAVLRGLAAGARLFRTPGAGAWEHPARTNISRELAALAGPSADAGPPR